MATAFIVGAVFGVVVCALIAGWVWIDRTPGDDHPLTGDEIRERVGEVFL